MWSVVVRHYSVWAMAMLFGMLSCKQHLIACLVKCVFFFEFEAGFGIGECCFSISCAIPLAMRTRLEQHFLTPTVVWLVLE